MKIRFRLLCYAVVDHLSMKCRLNAMQMIVVVKFAVTLSIMEMYKNKPTACLNNRHL